MPPDTPGDLDVTQPSPARVYDYLLGGTDNYAVDRQATERVLAQSPTVRDAAVANRRFLVRAVQWMCGAGVRQFLDLGSGLPTAENTHQVAAKATGGEARVVYVDRDPSVLAHARALLGDHDRAAYVHADIRDHAHVLDTAADHLDLTRPVGLLAVAVLHFIPDGDDPARLLRHYTASLTGGGHVAISSASSTGMAPELLAAIRGAFTNVPSPMVLRSDTEIGALLAGMRLVPPGLVPLQDWPTPSGRPPMDVPALAGVAEIGQAG